MEVPALAAVWCQVTSFSTMASVLQTQGTPPRPVTCLTPVPGRWSSVCKTDDKRASPIQALKPGYTSTIQTLAPVPAHVHCIPPESRGASFQSHGVTLTHRVGSDATLAFKASPPATSMLQKPGHTPKHPYPHRMWP